MVIFIFGRWTARPRARCWCASAPPDPLEEPPVRDDPRRGIPVSRRGFTIIPIVVEKPVIHRDFVVGNRLGPTPPRASSSEISPCSDDVFAHFVRSLSDPSATVRAPHYP